MQFRSMQGRLVQRCGIRRVLSSAAGALAATLILSSAPAFAAYRNQFIDDTCNQGGPNPTQFFAEGPPQFWLTANFTGGPDGCMMYTYHETTYDPVNGNQATLV